MTDHLKEGGKPLNINNKAFDAMNSVAKSDDVNINSKSDPFGEYKKRWHDPSLKKEYSNILASSTEKYGTKPAGFTGFIEESPQMRIDIMAAAKETGADPSFLYNVAMQEGMADTMSKLHKANIANRDEDWFKREGPVSLYESDREVNTFLGVGLDSLFSDQKLALGRGYLKSEIKKTPGSYRVDYGEKGMKSPSGDISSKDVWRGVGAVLQLNKDYMTSQFKKQGFDFSELSSEQQNFWTYASYNAGAGTAGKLLKSYGVDPLSNKQFMSDVKYGQKYGEIGAQHGPGFWMFNVGRVAGGTEATKLFKPFVD
jgi:hypothetical protein